MNQASILITPDCNEVQLTLKRAPSGMKTNRDLKFCGGAKSATVSQTSSLQIHVSHMLAAINILL